MYKNLMGLEADTHMSMKTIHAKKRRGPIVHLYAMTDSQVSFMDDVENEIKKDSTELAEDKKDEVPK